jgi:cobalt-zinc-cadmium resistance protein CzcA
MLERASEFILRQRFLVLLLGGVVLLLGGLTWTRLPVDAFPDVTNVQVMILTESQGLSPEEVERLITFPIETQMSGLPGVRQVRSLSQSGLSQVVVIFEDNVVLEGRAMARHKLSVETVNELLEAAVGGRVASTLYENPVPVDIVVRLPRTDRATGADLARLLVASPLGYRMPLSEVACVEQAESPAKINREDSRRRLLVECSVRGRDIGGFVAEARTRLAKIERRLPAGYRLVWGGQFENQQRAMRRLAVAALLIFVPLVYALKSLKSALLVMVSPLTRTGARVFYGILGLALLVFGIVVATGVVDLS